MKNSVSKAGVGNLMLYLVLVVSDLPNLNWISCHESHFHTEPCYPTHPPNT